MTVMRILAPALASALCLVALAHSPQAQDYPSKPITIVVPLAPGGGTDFLGRLAAKHLEPRLGKPFLIENKPGASNIIAATAVMKADPDGHTLMMGTSTGMAINASLRANLPYNPAVDFVPIAGMAEVPFILMVNSALPVNSVADLVKYAKEKPGLSFASSGIGTPHHLFMELFKVSTGIQLTHVPYRGSLPGATDVAAGHVQLMFCDYGPAEALMKAGKVRALGISTRGRLAAAPDIAPLAELGLPAFNANAWQMLVAPGKTPRPIVERLNAEMRAILATPEVKDAISSYGFVPMADASVSELQQFVTSEIAAWTNVVQRAGIAGSEQ